MHHNMLLYAGLKSLSILCRSTQHECETSESSSEEDEGPTLGEIVEINGVNYVVIPNKRHKKVKRDRRQHSLGQCMKVSCFHVVVQF